MFSEKLISWEYKVCKSKTYFEQQHFDTTYFAIIKHIEIFEIIIELSSIPFTNLMIQRHL